MVAEAFEVFRGPVVETRLTVCGEQLVGFGEFRFALFGDGDEASARVVLVGAYL